MLVITPEILDTFTPEKEDCAIEKVIERQLAVKGSTMFAKHMQITKILMILNPEIAMESAIIVNLSMGIEIGYKLGHAAALKEMMEGK